MKENFPERQPVYRNCEVKLLKKNIRNGKRRNKTSK